MSETLQIMSPRQIFIGGTGISGATILGEIFSKHPDFINYQEPNTFHGIEGVPGLNALMEGDIDINQLFTNITGSLRKKLVQSVEFQFSDAGTKFTPEIIEQIFKSSFIEGRSLKDAITIVC